MTAGRAGDVRYVVIAADGGSRGNPGVAGYGAVVYDAAGDEVLAERSEPIGVATNNVAEYRGLIAGLEAAAELGAEQVLARLDSKLVVEQMAGRWRVKHPDLKPLAAQAQKLASGFASVDFEWVPRAQNTHADRLANEAMDRGDASDQPAAPVAAADRSVARSAVQGPGWSGAKGRPTRMLLLRHGQTPLSVERRYSGRGNPALTELGRRQAAGAARRLAAKGGVTAVVSSPLARARETAEAAASALGLQVTVDEGLTETDFGKWEGLTFAEAAQRDPELHARWLGDPSVHPPGGESFDEVEVRVCAARDRIVEQYGAANVLVVSHVTPIKTLLRDALGVGPALLYRLHLELASLSIAEYFPDGGSSVRLVGDVSHLS